MFNSAFMLGFASIEQLCYILQRHMMKPECYKFKARSQNNIL